MKWLLAALTVPPWWGGIPLEDGMLIEIPPNAIIEVHQDIDFTALFIGNAAENTARMNPRATVELGPLTFVAEAYAQNPEMDGTVEVDSFGSSVGTALHPGGKVVVNLDVVSQSSGCCMAWGITSFEHSAVLRIR